MKTRVLSRARQGVVGSFLGPVSLLLTLLPLLPGCADEGGPGVPGPGGPDASDAGVSDVGEGPDLGAGSDGGGADRCRAAAPAIEEGKGLLAQARPAEALDVFVEAEHVAPGCPHATFGAALAELVETSELVAMTLGLVAGPGIFGALPPGPDRPGDVPSPSRSEVLAGDLHRILLDLQRRIVRAYDRLGTLTDIPGFRWESEAVPVHLRVEPSLVLRGRFDAGDVRLLRGVAAAAGCALGVLAGQDLRGDLLGTAILFEGRLRSGLDFPTLGAFLAYLLETDPRFLSVHPTDGEVLFRQCATLLATLGEDLVEAVAFMEAEAASGRGAAEDEVTAMQPGEEAGTRALVVRNRVAPGDGGTAVEVPLSLDLTDESLAAFLALSAAARGEGGPLEWGRHVAPLLGPLLFLALQADLLPSGLLARLPVPPESLTASGVTAFLRLLVPEVAALDLATFLQGPPVGLRTFLPEPSGGVAEGGSPFEGRLRAEWECPEDTGDDGFPTGTFRLLCARAAPLADGPHFVGTPGEVPADGLATRMATFFFQDPTFSGLLLVDLEGAGYRRPGTPAGLHPPDLGELNTAVAVALRGVIGFLE